MHKIQIINADSELGAGKRGGSLGFAAMLTAARKSEQTFFSEHEIIQLPNRNLVLDRPPVYSFAKRIHLLTAYYESLSNIVCESLQVGGFPIVVTGDHSSGGAVIAGIRQCNPDKRIGVVWIDAHADLHSPYTTPSGNMHGMPLAIATGIDSVENSRNELSDGLQVAWDRIKGAGGQTPSIDPADLFFIGLRSVEPQEWSIIDKFNIQVRTVSDLREKGLDALMNDVFEYFADYDIIHLSFDVDSMDPDLVSDGTGTPVPGGFSAEEAESLLADLIQDARVGSIEFTEINPTLDTRGNAMGEAAFHILETISGAIKKRFAVMETN
jgi:arginase